MDSRLLYAFMMYYDEPSDIIDELNLSHQEVLELLLERYRDEVYNLINEKFMGDFDKDIYSSELDLEELNWR